MKKILLRILIASTVILLSGCTYDSVSLNYAKKHNLSGGIYSDVKIQCITNNKLNESQIESIIKKVIVKSMHRDCDYDSKDMRKNHLHMGIKKYTSCIRLANLTNVISKSEKINETTRIKHIQTKNIYKEKKYGYWGYETVGDKTVIFSHGNILDIALENYIKNNQLHCDNIIGLSPSRQKSYIHKIHNIKDTDLGYKEKQQLLYAAVKVLAHPTKTDNGCILLPNSSKKITCFKIEATEIYRKDHINRNLSENSSKLINNIQSNLIIEFKKQIADYKKFKKLFHEATELRIKKGKQLSFGIIDNTNILNNEVKKALIGKVKVSYPFYSSYIIGYPALTAYKNLVIYPKNIYLGNSVSKSFNKFFHTPNDLEDSLAIKAIAYKSNTYPVEYEDAPYAIIDRYNLDYNKTTYEASYYSFKINTFFRVKNIYFDFIPKKYSASDMNIDIKVVNEQFNQFSRGRTEIKKLEVFNKSKNFIEINSIASYYDKQIKANIIKDGVKIKIPPKSSKIIKTIFKNWSTYDSWILLNNKNQKVKYGFSVEYTNGNLNTLYKVDNYSISDFEQE